ncbi:MAG TPA: response regulator transcription factor, partial [Desulfobacterales bacterium]|nr:response regulator transcription factor [Desulfobacterales bacterium]
MEPSLLLLIVVPDDSDRALLVRAAAGSGWEILAAASAADARRLLDGRRPAAVVAAERLADGSGFEFLLHLRGDREDCYTALVVDRPEVDTLLAVIEAEIDDCFVRPLAERSVQRRLDKALAAVGVRRELAESREELLRNFQTAQVVNTVLHVGLAELPLREKLQEVLDHLLSLPWLAFQRKGAIFLRDEAGGDLRLVVASGLAAVLMTSCRRIRPGQCLCGIAAQTGEVAFADCVDERHTVRYDGIVPHGHYIVPVRSQ